MLALLAPAASCYLTAFGQQSLYDLYNPFGPSFGRHPLGLTPLLDHASLLNRASLLNHPSPLLRTPRIDFSHALQHLDVLHDDTEASWRGGLRAKMAHDTKAHAKRIATRNANRLAQHRIHEGLLRELESSFKAHEQMFTQLRSHLEAAHVVAEEADAASFWHEADGNSGQLEATLRLPGSLNSKPKAVLSDSRHLTMTMTTTVRGEEGHFEQTVALPFAVRDPAAIELVHDEKGGTVTVRLAKPVDEVPPEPVSLPIVTAEPDKTKTKAVARADPKVAAQDKSVEEQLDERFADVVAARAAAKYGVAAETAEEAAAEATTEMAAEAARSAESEVAAAAQGQAAAPAEAEAATMVEPAAAAATPPSPADEHDAAAATPPSPADEHDCTNDVE